MERKYFTQGKTKYTVIGRPHVVILGAGASRAAFPNGDKNGRRLPLMNDFSEILGLDSLLDSWGIDPKTNFEDVYSDLHSSTQTSKLKRLEAEIEDYFSKLELPDKPTLYDHLILSLREQDLIATFNWDPFLVDAVRRNQRSGLSVPHLLFLHGNIRIGYCAKDKVTGLRGNICSKCRKKLVPSPLLYPISKKTMQKTSSSPANGLCSQIASSTLY